eukprot:XP_008679262.1 cytochrome P450 88A1-like isoform X2 [Zea mays]
MLGVGTAAAVLLGAVALVLADAAARRAHWWYREAAEVVLVGGVALVVVDAAARRAHGWYREAAARLPPGEMGWPLVGGMWAFLRAFKSGKPDAFFDSLPFLDTCSMLLVNTKHRSVALARACTKASCSAA